MKTVQSLLPVFGLVAAAQALGKKWENSTSSDAIVWTTITTDVYTTFCPESTTFTQGTKIYTATASETLTITDCPCTISKPVVAPTPTSSTLFSPPSNGTSASPVWMTTTEVVSEYTTYCPAPTTVVQGNKTYTATESTTLTITNCPCTQTHVYPAATTTLTISTLTTYCPAPTTIVLSAVTYPVTSSGTVTIPLSTPITTTALYPITTPVPTEPGVPATTAQVETSTPAGVVTTSYGTAIPTTKAPPAATSPIEVGNAASKIDAGFGVLAAAGLAAFLL